MCTRILWTGKVGDKISSICGRNMDWGIDMKEKLWVFPAGLKRKSDVKGKPVEWVSKYGSIATIVYDQATSDGMNEKGLAVHANWLAKSFYGVRDESKPGLDGDSLACRFANEPCNISSITLPPLRKLLNTSRIIKICSWLKARSQRGRLQFQSNAI